MMDALRRHWAFLVESLGYRSKVFSSLAQVAAVAVTVSREIVL